MIEALAKEGVLVSVDTYRTETARLAVEAGAHIVNDVWGLQRETDIAKIAAESGAGLVHHAYRARTREDGLTSSTTSSSSSAVRWRSHAQPDVPDEQLVLDPGFGFAKETAEENLDLMVRFAELHALGMPLMAGTSRKRFIGSATGREPADRGAGTAATSAILRLKGAALFRVHDVAINRDALAVADAMIARMDRRQA